MNVVEIQQLSKVYETRLRKGNVVALSEVSFEIKQGEIFGLLGPNGAGKTTLMKILLGITCSGAGTAFVMGLPCDDPACRSKTGYLPENHRFPEYLTGKGLLSLTGHLHGLSGREIDQRIDQLLELVDMKKWGDTKLRKYSKGMGQRIGLAQALMPDPDLLFLDEPTDGIDPVGRAEIRGILETIRTQGKTVLLNSHLLSEVESVADRVAILSKGRLVKTDTVANLTSRKSQYEIEAAIGDQFFEIQEEVGKKVSMSSERLIVELTKPEMVNAIIDQLRRRNINIFSVKPMKVSLEQSFLEMVSDNAPPPPGSDGKGGSR